MANQPKATTVSPSELKPENADESTLSDEATRAEHLDDRAFKFRVEFFNRDGDRLILSRGAIEELEIHDSVYNWWLEGHIIYKNPKDWAERQEGFSETTGEETDKWNFRGDGRDYIKILIDPILDIDPLQDRSPQGFDTPAYTISLFACIYDVEDISGEDEGDRGKSKKLKFWDYRYHSMQEKNSYWNSVEACMRKTDLRASRRPPSHMSNSSRSLLTGLAIQDLLEVHMKTLDGEVEYEQYDGEETWNNGSSTIFHHAGGNESAADTLDYLLSCHISDNSTGQQPCILSLSRDEKWSLLPVEEYYIRAYDKQLKQADGWLSELFLLAGEGTNDLNRIPPSPKTPGGFDWFFNVYNEDTNNVNDYEFTQMSYMDHPTSVNVHAYDHKAGQFVIHQEQGDIENVKSVFQSTIVDNTYGDFDTGAQAAMVLNEVKIQNKSITNISSSGHDRSSAISVGRNQSLKQMLFLGNAIHFTSKGSTLRQSGRLIGLDRQSYYNETDYDSKLLGCYLTTSVIHKVTPSGYFNDIVGVKPFYFKDLNFNEENA